ncbi:MAG: hypothetical protein L0K86_17155 [Actinomycetia bacterium]|nr:hypothetical protein [Actinomycetes bacterium]
MAAEVLDAGRAGLLRELLAALLAEIDAGRLDATATGRARIEGAIVALDVLSGAEPADIVDRLTAR